MSSHRNGFDRGTATTVPAGEPALHDVESSDTVGGLRLPLSGRGPARA
ncbi:hypothetical protein [Streptomyces sp. NPDC004270]